MKILGKLFGSPAMVKLLRLFIFNPEHSFTNKEAATRAKITADTLRLELSIMKQMGFVKKKVVYRQTTTGKGKRKTVKKKKVSAWTLDEKFPYIESLRGFLVNATPVKNKDIPKRLSVAGVIKLIVISGVFIQNLDSRIDLLIVGNGIKKGQLETAIKSIESEIGRELRYAVFETQEFKYRMGIYDRLIRDVFDYEHDVILDKIGIAENPTN
ncbi:MAG: hypothetical protein ISR98_01125 [Parcubacteria group bacterium]|nr:hypothetical protein [Parcubacteria group bacterium]